MGLAISGLTMAPVGPVCLPVHPPSLGGFQPSLVSVPQVQSEWGVAEQRWQEGLARCREEAEAHLREVQQRVDILPQQVGEGWGGLPLPAVPTLSRPPAPHFR